MTKSSLFLVFFVIKSRIFLCHHFLSALKDDRTENKEDTARESAPWLKHLLCMKEAWVPILTLHGLSSNNKHDFPSVLAAGKRVKKFFYRKEVPIKSHQKQNLE